MRIRSTLINLIAKVFLVFGLSACGENAEPKQSDKAQTARIEKLELDTSKVAIIPFDQNANYPFGNSHKPAVLTYVEIEQVDSLLIESVTNYNNSLDKDHKQYSIDLSKRNYRKQLVAVLNKSGDKEVWVNVFCSTWDRDWHKDVLMVHDGGNCYFNLKINLTKRKCYDLTVNGEA